MPRRRMYPELAKKVAHEFKSKFGTEYRKSAMSDMKTIATDILEIDNKTRKRIAKYRPSARLSNGEYALTKDERHLAYKIEAIGQEARTYIRLEAVAKLNWLPDDKHGFSTDVIRDNDASLTQLKTLCGQIESQAIHAEASARHHPEDEHASVLAEDLRYMHMVAVRCRDLAQRRHDELRAIA